MTTKTDFHSIMELKESFKPKERGWIDQEEAVQVKNVLELDARTDEEMDAYMDAMSAICAVVDDIKMRRGLGV